MADAARGRRSNLSAGAKAPAILDAGGSWGALGGRLLQPVNDKARRQRNAFRHQPVHRYWSIDGGQANQSDIGRVEMRHDIILVVIG
jgi:hypothetical protein